MSGPDPDIAACAGIVQRADPDRFLAVMAAPVPVREKLFPLLAFNVEVARAPWLTEESMIAEMRLQWWRDALEEIATGQTVRRHEVVTPLARILSASDVDALDRLIEARRWDIYKDPFESKRAFQAYLKETAGTLVGVAASICGYKQNDALSAIGYAHGLCQWARALPKLVSQGRKPFFMNDLKGLQEEAQAALKGLKGTGHRALPAKIRPAVYMCWQDELLLKRIIASPERALEGTIESSEFRKRIGLIRYARWPV